MSAETAGLSLGLKTGLIGAAAVFMVSVLAIAVGFTVVPLKPGDEIRDAARRISCGLLCSFSLGLIATAKALAWQPDVLPVLLRMFGGDLLWAHVAAATPFFALFAVLGFWIVAAVMLYAQRREGKDIAQQFEEMRKSIGGQP